MIDTAMSNAAYHATDAISSSDVKAVATKSVAHWKARSPYTSSPAFDVGTVVHDMVLEGGKNSLRGPIDRRGNAWKDAYAEAEAIGRTLLTCGDYDLARSMADSILFHPAGRRMESDTKNEMSIFVNEPTTGLAIKARPDAYHVEDGICYDIKTCQDASPDGFARDAWSYRYAIQAAFYTEVLRLEGLRPRKFVFVCVEKFPPFATAIHILDTAYMAWGRNEMISALEKIRAADQTGVVSTGYPEINTLSLPRWAENDF